MPSSAGPINFKIPKLPFSKKIKITFYGLLVSEERVWVEGGSGGSGW